MTIETNEEKNTDCLSAVKERLKSANEVLDKTESMTSHGEYIWHHCGNLSAFGYTTVQFSHTFIFCHLLDIQDALQFLQAQQEKVIRAKQALMELTEEILPTTKRQSTDKMTTREVAEALRELQLMYSRQQDRLVRISKDRASQKEASNDSNKEVSETDPFAEPLVHFASTPMKQKITTPTPSSRFKSRIQTPFSAGPNLSDVPETDNETDAESTVQNHQQTPNSLSSSIHSKRPPASFENTKTWPATPQSSKATPTDRVLSTGRKRRNAFMQLELCLQRDVHKASALLEGENEDDGHDGDLEDCSNTEKDKSTSHDEPSWDLGREDISGPGMNKEEPFSTTVKETHAKTLNYSIDDDSALYCATVVASKDNPTPKGTADSNAEDHPELVIFTPENEGVPSSPNDHTVLTFDEDINGTNANNNPQMSHQLEAIAESGSVISASSTETPILERYRLDIDENSPYGVKVVPNFRGKEARNQPALQQQKSPPKQSRIALQPSSRYRKTPHPDKRVKTLRVSPPVTIDENKPLSTNDLNGMCTPQSHRSPLASILSSGGSHNNISLLTSPATRPRTLKLANTVGREAVDCKVESGDCKGTIRQSERKLRRPHLSPVSILEYEAAPQVVKQQVPFDKVKESTSLINQALSVCKATATPAELTIADLQDILGSSERESKTIAMTLCHWRRLILKRHSLPNEHEPVDHLLFVVNTSYRSSRSPGDTNVGQPEMGVIA